MTLSLRLCALLVVLVWAQVEFSEDQLIPGTHVG